MDVDREAGLRGSRSEGDRERGIAATAHPVRGTALHAQVSVGTVDISSQCVGVIGLHRDDLIALARCRIAGGQLSRVRAAMDGRTHHHVPAIARPAVQSAGFKAAIGDQVSTG